MWRESSFLGNHFHFSIGRAVKVFLTSVASGGTPLHNHDAEITPHCQAGVHVGTGGY